MNKRMKSLSSRLTGRACAAQSGMTLIEIMIVLAIIAVVMGFLVGPRVIRMFGESKEKTAMLRAQQFVEAHTEWSMNNDDSCPSSLDDLVKYTNSKETKDPWGQEYVLVCGEGAPEGVQFGVLSKGEDRKEGTADDVKSWEMKKKDEKKE
jgi:prepilin-type N-terminal cleavage/methylation domain-containing protein